MSRIFWDTNLFIYFFEGNSEFSVATRRLRQNMVDRGDQLLTSALTLGEILVKPLEKGDIDRCRLYEKLLSETAHILTFDAKAARRYASIRLTRSVKAPDAMQLACAGEAGVDLFITNDRRLQGKQVDGVQFIVSLEQAPL